MSVLISSYYFYSQCCADEVVATNTRFMELKAIGAWKQHPVSLAPINASFVGVTIRIQLVPNGDGKWMIL